MANVRVDDKFWTPRVEINRTRSLEHQYEELIKTGRIANFEIAAGTRKGEFQGRYYNDSDVYKWIEAASYSLAAHPDAKLDARIDEVIIKIGAAQQKDGYLHTFIQLLHPDEKWANLARYHEDYCAGHLIEAAIAHHEATGKRNLLAIAVKFADHIDSIFGPGKRDGTSGHQEIELALVKLYRTTGEKRYLRLAGFFLDQRGQKPSYFEREYRSRKTESQRATYQRFIKGPDVFDTSYCQDHLPVRQQSEVVGHAVRAMYMYSGMADVAYETGDQSLVDALTRLHHNVTLKRMYVTGGIGPSRHNEGFTRDYDLPNDSAYQETCASVGMILWNYRMLKLTGDGQYADVLEQSLYNAFLAGVSLSGDTFFYANPLYCSAVNTRIQGEEHISNRRQGWFTTACCPPNVSRLLPSLGKYLYSQSPDAVWVNLYVGSNINAELAGGRKVTLRQTNNYPWDGNIRLEVGVDSPQEFGIHLRIPGWARNPQVRINGNPVASEIVAGYLELKRRWANGDRVELTLPMEAERLEANPEVPQDLGKVALRRGPLVYCLEQADNDGDIDQMVLPVGSRLESRFEPGVLNGVTVITGQAKLFRSPSWSDQLYRPAVATTPEQVKFRAIPYYAWANRQEGKMAVWITASN
ncbi:MAG TPA: beta-L-arabinofuranosidase domain-containing protein [Terriglobia bacterium]|nr:beta-L-arabinofuranosidase domain-containing protein [Terriglobia bacterium]